MLYIEVPDMNDSVSDISIDNQIYRIRFTYNAKYDFWSFGIRTANDDPIIEMVRIVPNFPLLHWITDSRLPDGIWGCISDLEDIGRYAFKNKTAEFVYIPNSDLEE